MVFRVAEPLCPHKRATLDEKSQIPTNIVENTTRAKEYETANANHKKNEKQSTRQRSKKETQGEKQ